MHWFAPQSSGEQNAAVCVHLRSAVAGCFPVGRNQVDASFLESLPQRVKAPVWGWP